MSNVLLLILFIALITLGIHVSYMTALQIEANKYYDYIKYRTKFHYRKDPNITCCVIHRENDFVFNSRLNLMVTYPSGNTCKLITTTGAFTDLWIED